MQRIFNVDKWVNLPQGSQVEFPSTRPRRIRLEVNAPGDCTLYVVQPDGDLVFLALVRGRDTVEFVTDGKVGLMADGADCWIYTADGDDVSSVIPDAQSFTRIMERRQRNPELERIAAEMRFNTERRLEKQADELSALFAKRMASVEAQLAASAASRTVQPEPTPPEAEGNAPAPADPIG